MLFNVAYNLTYGRNLLSILIRDFPPEFLFKCHNQFNEIERICFKFLLKTSLRRNFALLNAKEFNNNCLDIPKGI